MPFIYAYNYTYMKKSVNQCLDCGAELTGRVDKKFCSPYCKSSYHYDQNKEKEKGLYAKIDSQLKMNRRILKRYNKEGKSTIRRYILTNEGFDPNFFTHYWKAGNGNVYLFCYEFGFMKIIENNTPKYVLVHWQDYMNKK